MSVCYRWCLILSFRQPLANKHKPRHLRPTSMGSAIDTVRNRYRYHSAPTSTFPASTIEKKGAFLLLKIDSVPVTQLRRKSLQVLRFSHDSIRLFIKKLKKFTKKNIFPYSFTSKIIPIATQIPDLIIG